MADSSNVWTFVLAFAGGGLGAFVSPMLTARYGRAARRREIQTEPYNELMKAAAVLREALSYWPIGTGALVPLEEDAEGALHPVPNDFRDTVQDADARYEEARRGLEGIGSPEVIELAQRFAGVALEFRGVIGAANRPIDDWAELDPRELMDTFSKFQGPWGLVTEAYGHLEERVRSER